MKRVWSTALKILLPPDPPSTISTSPFSLSTIYRTFGGIQLDVNQPQSAFDNFTRQLHALKKLRRSADDLALAHGYSNTALASLSLSDFGQATIDLEIAQNIRDKHPEKAKGGRALMLDVSGIMYGLQGQHEKAVSLLTKAIELYDEDQGMDNYLSAL